MLQKTLCSSRSAIMKLLQRRVCKPSLWPSQKIICNGKVADTQTSFSCGAYCTNYFGACHHQSKMPINVLSFEEHCKECLVYWSLWKTSLIHLGLEIHNVPTKLSSKEIKRLSRLSSPQNSLPILRAWDEAISSAWVAGLMTGKIASLRSTCN